MNSKQAFSRYDGGAQIKIQSDATSIHYAAENLVCLTRINLNAITNIPKKRKMNPKNAEWIMIIIAITIVFLIVRFIVIPLNQWMKRNKKN